MRMELPLTAPKSPLLTFRSCKYCNARFIPNRPQDKGAKFCCPAHRKAYWAYGRLPYEKMALRLEKQLRKQIRETVREELALSVTVITEPTKAPPPNDRKIYTEVDPAGSLCWSPGRGWHMVGGPPAGV